MNRSQDKSIFPCYLRARDLLIRDHLQDEPVVRACLSSPIFQSGSMEPYFRALLSRSKDREILARARMALVQNNRLRARVAARPYFDHPEDHPEYLESTRFLNGRLDPGYIDYFRTADVLSLSAENQALLERVVAEFGDVPQAPSWARAEVKARMQGRTLGLSAQTTLDALRSLAVGKVAPEIEGQDVDGKPMKLSDYRGKVVVLVFWGTWCGPCMRSIPMEKALAERLKDRPFAIVGINSDQDREKLKARIVEEGITWRSWFDGGKAGGPIAGRWDVHGWPTIIVIDQEGVIRFKNLPHHTPKPLDDAVDSLLAGPKP
jgi:thiol-disulfide isomerase/thioredoxin